MKIKIKEIILLIIFIMLASYTVISIKDYITRDESADLTDASDIAETLNTDIENIANNNETQTSEQNTQEDEIVVADGIFAVIDIPSVGVRGKVVQGTDDETLKNYIGMFKGCNLPGEYGNFCVAAHNNIYTEIFRNLHKVVTGDKIRVITREYEYVYLVRSVNEIAPTQTDVLDPNYAKKEITLITCTDMGQSRIVVKGDLISQNVIKK